MASPMSPSLTDLPDSVVGDILVRLPFREAVRTSVLSRAWRRRWHSIPELVLDDRLVPAAAIRNVLLLLPSAPLRRFCLVSSYTAHARRWILSLPRRGAGHLLSLELSFLNFGRPFPVPSSVFSFRETLTHLHLFRCDLSLPPPCSFPALRSLELLDVDFPDVLVSLCPALEKFRIIAAGRYGSLRFRSPNLRSLDLGADCDRVELTSGQTLHDLSIYLGRKDADVELAELFRGVVCEYQLSLLRLTMGALAKRSIPESMVSSFQGLRSLHVAVSLVDSGQIAVMLCLARSAPNLQQLTIEGLDYGWLNYGDDATGPGEDFWIANQSVELFASLRTVDMKSMVIQEPEMELMRFILARAQVLETLTIGPSSTEITRHRVTELWELPRTSTRAQIIFAHQGEDETDD